MCLLGVSAICIVFTADLHHRYHDYNSSEYCSDLPSSEYCSGLPPSIVSPLFIDYRIMNNSMVQYSRGFRLAAAWTLTTTEEVNHENNIMKLLNHEHYLLLFGIILCSIHVCIVCLVWLVLRSNWFELSPRSRQKVVQNESNFWLVDITLFRGDTWSAVDLSLHVCIVCLVWLVLRSNWFELS